MNVGLLDVLACPACQGELATAQDGGLTCVQGHRYAVDGGVPRLLEPEPGFADHAGWERKQAASISEYEADAAHPELLHDTAAWTVGRLFGEAWSEHARGARVLDVGCALRPEQAYCPPTYRPERVRVHVGLDPLSGGPARTYEVVQGVAEALPFRSASFDAVLFGSSLDHIVDARQALREARRVLVTGGRVAVWVSIFDAGLDSSVLSALRLVPRRRWWRPSWLLALARVIVALQRSAGIDWSDAYHVHRFTQAAVEQVVVAAGFALERRLVIVDHVQQVPHLVVVGRADR